MSIVIKDESALRKTLKGLGYEVPEFPEVEILADEYDRFGRRVQRRVRVKPKAQVLGLHRLAGGTRVRGIRINADRPVNPIIVEMSDDDLDALWRSLGYDPDNLPVELGGRAKGVEPIVVKKAARRGRKAAPEVKADAAD